MFLLNSFKNRYTKEFEERLNYNQGKLKSNLKRELATSNRNSKGFTDKAPNLERQKRIKELKTNQDIKRITARQARRDGFEKSVSNVKSDNNFLDDLFDNNTSKNLGSDLEDLIKKPSKQNVAEKVTQSIPKKSSAIVPVNSTATKTKTKLLNKIPGKKLALLGGLAVGGGLLANKIRKDRKKRKDKGILRGKYKL